MLKVSQSSTSVITTLVHIMVQNAKLWGDAAKWFIEPVTDNVASYFGVAPAEKMKGKNGKYFTSLYTDFPMKIVDNINAYIVESIGTTGAQKGYAQCKKIASQGDVIPAGHTDSA